MGRSLQGLILALLLAAPAQAQECKKRELSSKPHKVPTGVLCNIHEQQLACFTLEEYTLILEVDHELYTLKQKSAEKDKIIENQGLIIQQNQIVIETLEKDKEILEGQVSRMGTKWRECLDENEGFPWSSMLVGIGAGVLTGIVAGVVTFLVINNVPERAE